MPRESSSISSPIEKGGSQAQLRGPGKEEREGETVCEPAGERIMKFGRGKRKVEL